MTRAERRRAERETKTEPVYSLTASQLRTAINNRVDERLAELKKQATDDAVNTAMLLLLTLPLEVLMDHYWQKSYPKKIPEFTNHILDYYEKWQNGELDMEKMKEDLWEYGGVRLEEREE